MRGEFPSTRRMASEASRHAASPGQRLAYLDNLKTGLIAGIIASHAVMGYATFGSWTYQDVQEVTLSDVVEKIYAVAFLAFGGLFLMALFFLISGLFTQDSLARKGPSGSYRIGSCDSAIPFAVYTLVVWPVPRVRPARTVPPPRLVLAVVRGHRPGARQRS